MRVIGLGSDDERPLDPKIVRLTMHPMSPEAYRLEDPACLDDDAPVAIDATQIYAWEGDDVVTRQVSLTGVKSEASLTSAMVETTAFNLQYERVCDLKRGRDRACDGTDGVEKGWLYKSSPDAGALRICKNNHAYGRETFEGVALTSLYYIERANSRYMELSQSEKRLPAISLSVLPQFVDYYDNFIRDGQPTRLKTFITHNLAYFQQGQMIAVFPENVVDGDSAKGFFWESEFVLAHEFGHHIDWARHGQTLADLGLKWSPLAHRFVDELAIAQGRNAVSSRGQIVGAAAEAFADLLAYYAEGATSRSLIGMQDLGQNRDIGSPTFASGHDKVLTEARLQVMLSGDETQEAEEGAPNFADIHIGGAILAHTLDNIFKSLVEADPEVQAASEISLSRRYQLTLVWMEAFTKGLRALGDNAPVSDPVISGLETAVNGYLSRFPLAGDLGADDQRVEVCKRAKALLPGLTKAPFDSVAGC